MLFPSLFRLSALPGHGQFIFDVLGHGIITFQSHISFGFNGEKMRDYKMKGNTQDISRLLREKKMTQQTDVQNAHIYEFNFLF